MYSTVKCSAVQYSTVQCSIIQYSTVQYGAVLYSTDQFRMSFVLWCLGKCCAKLWETKLDCAALNWVRWCSLSLLIYLYYKYSYVVQYFTVFCCAAIFCTVLYCTVLSCAILYQTTLHYTEHYTTMQYTFSPRYYIIHSKICRAIPVWSSQLESDRDLCTTCLYRPDQL